MSFPISVQRLIPGLAVIVCSLSFFRLHSQSFSGHPSFLNWKKLESPLFTIFYPEVISGTAINVANSINRIYSNDSALGTKKFKVNIVLQNQTVNSNGYVGIAPFMSEYFLNPPHDPYILGPINWAEALSIHEYRHVSQYMNSRKGINKVLYTLFGEEFWGGSFGLVVPDWFLEGDAVYAETKYSNAGRGRMANFSMPFRALSNYSKSWNYSQSRNGSYKKLLPNHYVFGYPMVKYIYDHFGESAWKKIYNDAVNYKYPLFPFNSALKKNTGLSVRNLYSKVRDSLTLDRPLEHDTLLVGNTSRNTIKQFKTPYRIKDGYLIYLENARNKLPAFVLDHHGKKTELGKLGISGEIEYGFTYPLISFTRTSADPRWENRDYSDVWTLNIITKEKKRLTFKQKLFNPTPSSDASALACVEYLPDGTTKSVILDTSGKKLFEHPYPAGTQISFPTFSHSDQELISVLRDHGTSTIIRQKIGNPLYESISAPVPAVISNLFVVQDTLYFSSDINGIDNIYAGKIGSYKYDKVTENAIGIQQFSIRGNEILYNILGSKGIEIRSLKLSECTFIPADLLSPSELNQKLESRTTGTNMNYIISDASRINNTFRVYAWNWNPQEGANVFSIKGRNVLNTISGSVNYAYQNSDRSHSFSMESSLGSAYPILSGAISKNVNRNISKRSNPLEDSIRWNETVFRIGLTIPWKWINQNSHTSIQPYISLATFLPDYNQGERINYQQTNSIRSGIRFSNQRVKANQHVSSRWLQYIDLQWNRAINNNASAINILSEFHLPGMAKNHAVELRLDYNNQPLSDPYRFLNRAMSIRGYNSFSSDRTAWFRAAYHFPLIYPDQGINGIYFLQRIRSRLFYETSESRIVGTRRTLDINYKTIGAEILFDGKLGNAAQASFGFRFYKPLNIDLITNKKKSSFDFIVEQLF